MGQWFILADDLTGAADCAIAFGRRGLAAAVTWGDATAIEPDRLTALSYDADSRGLSPERAAQRHTEILERLLEPDRILFKKIDSTLRGQPAAETAAAIAVLKARTGTAFGILAPAFPATGRATVGAHIHVDGRPLEEAEVWQRDHTYANANLASVLASAGVLTATVPLATVRGPDLATTLARIAAAGAGIAICDAETDDDLDRIATAGLSRTTTFFIGSAGLAHALAAVETAAPPEVIQIAPNARGSLIVVGSLATASRTAARKVAGTTGVVHFPVWPETLRGTAAEKAAFAGRVAAAIAAGDDALIEIATDGLPDMALGQRLVDGLADALVSVAPQIGAIAATGGETAASLLARFGVTGIRLVDEIEPGVSLGLTLGRLSIPIVTKAGAFGDEDSLIRIGARLRAIRTKGRFS